MTNEGAGADRSVPSPWNVGGDARCCEGASGWPFDHVAPDASPRLGPDRSGNMLEVVTSEFLTLLCKKTDSYCANRRLEIDSSVRGVFSSVDPLPVRDSLIDPGQRSRDLRQVGNAWDIAGVRKIPPKFSANIPLISPQISPKSLDYS